MPTNPKIREKPKLLLTGASGFIGISIIPYLKDTLSIITLGRQPVSNTIHIKKDLTDPGNGYGENLFSDLDIVIHAAALTRKATDDKNSPEEYMRVNVTGTKNLLQELENHAHRLTYFLYVSTCDVYAPSSEIITENSAVEAQNPYAESKISAENEVKSWCDSHGILWGIVRLGNIYGPHEQTYGKFIPIAIKTALGMKPISIKGSGHALRDVLYRSDAARSVAQVVRSRGCGIYSSVSGRSISVKSIAEEINRITGNKTDYPSPIWITRRPIAAMMAQKSGVSAGARKLA